MRKTNPELHDRRRDELLEAAEHCFIERGFHKTTIQDIASAAGVSLGLLYRYYQNKEAVILAVAEREREATIELISSLIEADDFISELQHVMRIVLRESTEPNYVRLSTEIFAEACRNPVFAEALSHSDSSVRDTLIKAISTQQKANKISLQVSPPAVADVLIALSDGLGVQALLNPKLKLRPIENLMETIIAAMMVKK